ncbi:carboxy-S-adenosyl-L-methionine synthase CmoA [Halopseudomonas phragmitis]|uniref:Carboxy-S-adenosyl-L-methionine synthase n=2 Tax=Pseudomonadaceae TaxID=135621 RepID=A0A1V0B7L0_9GAMM|nr:MULTISPECIES: carboxy-S-adenosyl-L-methionine synthase CmoA [Pseudomonadaceae]AQZ95909.1 carboxy-S-adenosyl-L-methionine synthase CmoA [Halopseudomonas phragmitis]PAU88850.1 carboxy-S-adenosyl-L-methionine synthase CmoA [Pseudomonas sp. WN033]RHW21095.1 carboxy-S-adenosyl-L-methionine synthase CmoA [Pseudomonas jilinensis]
MNDVDKLFAQPLTKVSDFVFDHDVARVFPDMIKRSVPGYPTIVETIGLIAGQHAGPHTLIYDLGCSLGAATQSMRRHVRSQGCRIIAVDNAPAMVERCREYLSAQSAMTEELTPAEVIEADILELPLQPCSVVVLNFTLQFINPELRLPLLSRIRQALKPGGILLLSEKLRFDDPDQQQRLENLHYAFKRANGYSELEIAQKRSAIENVMRPDTLDTHLQRLQQAGFSQAHSWFQCLNFCSMIATCD